MKITKWLKMNLRRVVGVVALALGVYSIIEYSVITGNSYFVGLISGFEFVTITYHLLIIYGFIHKFVMIKDYQKMNLGFLTFLFFLVTFVATKYSSPNTCSVNNPNSYGAEVNYLLIIFVGWPIIDLLDFIATPLRTYK